MKTTLLFALLYSANTIISAFTVRPAPTTVQLRPSVAVFSGPEEEEGLDLNLEEMFDMFDAADKEEKFDLEKIKGDD